MNTNESVVAVYPSLTAAEGAVKELQRAGYDMKTLSIVARDHRSDQHVVGYYNAGDRMKVWGATGAFWGGLWGLLVGSAFFWIPGFGPLLIGGPLVSWLVGTLEGAIAVGGFSVIGAALYGVGIPRDSILRYETAIRTGKFVLIAHGVRAEALRARDILHVTEPETLEHHELDPHAVPSA